MGKFVFEDLIIKGLKVITPTVFGDNRGFFIECYNKQDFFDNGIQCEFVQDNHSFSVKNVIRGLHFQKIKPQDKLVRVIKGEVYDVAVDLRKDSPTFGHWAGVVLSENNRKQLFIPKGFAHGFAVISETAEFVYKCSDFYYPQGEDGIIWNDKTLNIDWDKYINVQEAVLSEKDKKYQSFEEYITAQCK
jgi:dTDP-4-dehydrorhamnose 3,5-epimerase